jgi:hypothetical protein
MFQFTSYPYATFDAAAVAVALDAAVAAEAMAVSVASIVLERGP